MSHKSVSKMGLLFGLGVAAGWVGSIFLSDKQRQAQKKAVLDVVEQLRAKLDENEEIRRAKEVFADRAQQAVAEYNDVRETILQRLAALQTNWESVDLTKYRTVVRNTLRELVEEQRLSEEQFTALYKYFQADYEQLFSSMTKPATKKITRRAKKQA